MACIYSCVRFGGITHNLYWVKTADAFESAGMPLELANPLKTKAIAWASIKNDTIDARTLAHLLRAGLVAGCYISSAKTRG